VKKIAKFYDDERGQPWTIRVIDKGDKYGLEDCLTHEDEEPIVEFYDADNEHTIDEPSGIMLGQFVSRYYISTIADGQRGGLDLMGYEPKWKMDAPVMDSVRSYLTAYDNEGAAR
jgi:hypothetical protein